VTLPPSFCGSAVGKPSPSYQWFRNGLRLPDERTAKLTISRATDADAGTLYCDVTNDVGGVRSTACVVTVTHSAPVLVSSPESTARRIGEDTVLRVQGGCSVRCCCTFKCSGHGWGGCECACGFGGGVWGLGVERVCEGLPGLSLLL
jgi:hypothetical protein